MLVTVIASLVMMAGLFLMLWAAVGFIQDKRLFGSAPEAVRSVIQPRGERFPGARRLGWRLMLLALALMLGALAFGGLDGVAKGFGFRQLFIRYLIMLLALQAFDILLIDLVLLCRSGFFSYYFPEVAPLLGPHLFGYNRKRHLLLIVLCPVAAAALAGLCILLK